MSSALLRPMASTGRTERAPATMDGGAVDDDGDLPLYHVDGLAAMVWHAAVAVDDIARFVDYYCAPSDAAADVADVSSLIEPTLIVPDGLVSFSKRRSVVYCYDRGVVVETVAPWHLADVRAVTSTAALRQQSGASTSRGVAASSASTTPFVLATSTAAALEDGLSHGGVAAGGHRDARSPSWTYMVFLGSTKAVVAELFDGLRGLHASFVDIVDSEVPFHNQAARDNGFRVPKAEDEFVRKSARQQTLEHAKFLQHEARRVLSHAGLSLVGRAAPSGGVSGSSTPTSKRLLADPPSAVLAAEVSEQAARQEGRREAASVVFVDNLRHPTPSAAQDTTPGTTRHERPASSPRTGGAHARPPSEGTPPESKDNLAQCPYCLVLGGGLTAPWLNPHELRHHLLDQHLHVSAVERHSKVSERPGNRHSDTGLEITTVASPRPQHDASAAGGLPSASATAHLLDSVGAARRVPTSNTTPARESTASKLADLRAFGHAASPNRRSDQEPAVGSDAVLRARALLASVRAGNVDAASVSVAPWALPVSIETAPSPSGGGRGGAAGVSSTPGTPRSVRFSEPGTPRALPVPHAGRPTATEQPRCKWCQHRFDPATDHEKRCGYRMLSCRTCGSVVALRDRKEHAAVCRPQT